MTDKASFGIWHTIGLVFFAGIVTFWILWFPLLDTDQPDYVFYVGFASGFVAAQGFRILIDEYKARWGGYNAE